MSRRSVRVFAGLCLGLLAAGCRSLALEQGPWIEVRTPTFRLLSQVDRERSVEMARSLERFQSVVKIVIPPQRFEPRVPTTILLLKRMSYRQLGPEGTGGLFMPRQRGNYALVDASYRGRLATGVLLHEYTHFLVNNDTAFTYPSWYGEGIAEVMRGTIEQGDSILIGGVLEDRLLPLDALRSYPLRRLLAEPASGHSQVTSQIYYAKAWLLVQYLTYGSGLGDRTRQLVDYLRLAHGGAPPEQACREAFGVGIDELERELELYLRKGRAGTWVLPRTAIAEPSEPAVRNLGADEAALELGTAALMLGDGPRAELLFRSLLALQPDSERAHFGLADALRLQERHGEYPALYERGLELGGDQALGQLDYGEYLLARAHALPPEAAAERRELATRARQHLRRAAELAPELPEAHAQLAASYLALPGEQDVAQGLPVIEQAHALLGSDAEITYLLALGLYQAGRIEEAGEAVVQARARSHERLDAVEALAERIASAVPATQAPVAAPPAP
jgi:hypothetical protein